MPSVDGARTPPNATSIAASRNRSVSAMLSAPATIPAEGGQQLPQRDFQGEQGRLGVAGLVQQGRLRGAGFGEDHLL